jgi:hypothetical protein
VEVSYKNRKVAMAQNRALLSLQAALDGTDTIKYAARRRCLYLAGFRDRKGENSRCMRFPGFQC